MQALNKIYVLIFVQVLAPVCVILGLILNGVVLDSDILPGGVRQSLNWFQQNPDISNVIVWGLYISAGIFAVIAIALSIYIYTNSRGVEDKNLGMEFKKTGAFKE